jgi:pimeloyl-ACP methyl ester carboxylesterase
VPRRSRGTGRYAASEADMVITSSTYRSGGPLVVVCHGFSATPSNYSPPANRRDLDLLAETGCVVAIGALGGGSTWGNDTFLARLADIRTWAASAWGADLTRMALIGDSMGGMGALNYAWRNPTLVKAVALRVPVVAADALHDRDPSGLGAGIDAAYGGTAAWENTHKAQRDPSLNTASITAFGVDKVRIWYSTNDPTVLPADITSFTAATGVRAVPLGDVAHQEASIYAAVHAEDQAAWLWSRLNA